MSDTDHNNHAILTSSPAADIIALKELQSSVPGVELVYWLDPGIGLVELPTDWDTLASELREHPPVFTRHICPAQVRVPLNRTQADLDKLAQACDQLINYLDPTRTLSVQTRIMGGDRPYGNYDVNMLLSDIFVQRGVRIDVRRPEQVVSVILTHEVGYIGLSLSADNISDWAGGARRFKRDDDQISRAEFKLLEALDVFGMSLPPGGHALDLGAAPGGWTRVLRNHDMTVTAVDPGDMDLNLARDPDVRHIRKIAQSHLRSTSEKYDVIVNDMRMDAAYSARVIVAASRNLAKGGWALMTLKLPSGGMGYAATDALEILSDRYSIIGARQLFHNRNEVTVAVESFGRKK
jgi:23S rRNA (cytidine2498-2'-O)-methyltransferase